MWYQTGRVVFCVIIFILSVLAYKMLHFLFFDYKIQSLNWNSYNNAFQKKNLIWNKNQQLSGILVILYTICLVSEYFFSCHMRNKKFQAFKTWILNQKWKWPKIQFATRQMPGPHVSLFTKLWIWGQLMSAVVISEVLRSHKL